MNSSFKVCGTGFLAGVLAFGCINAKTPNVSLNYFLPKSKLQLEVNRTIGCRSDGTLIVRSVVTPTLSHMADTEARRKVRIIELDRALSKSNLEFGFYKDGRLKSINTEETGQGASIVESAVSLAPNIQLLFDGQQLNDYSARGETEKDDSVREENENSYCTYIEQVNKKTKTLTLTFRGPLKLEDHCGLSDGILELEAVADSETYVRRLGDIGDALGTFHATTKCMILDDPVEFNWTKPRKYAGVALMLRKPSKVNIDLKMSPNNDVNGLKDFWSASFMMARPGGKNMEYEVPIPKAAWIGKRTFNLLVSESGIIEKIGYSKESGLPEGIGAAEKAFETFGAGAAARTRLAELELKAKLIAAQEKLVRCQRDPTDCK